MFWGHGGLAGGSCVAGWVFATACLQHVSPCEREREGEGENSTHLLLVMSCHFCRCVRTLRKEGRKTRGDVYASCTCMYVLDWISVLCVYESHE